MSKIFHIGQIMLKEQICKKESLEFDIAWLQSLRFETSFSEISFFDKISVYFGVLVSRTAFFNIDWHAMSDMLHMNKQQHLTWLQTTTLNSNT